ncbi:hypothetical protein GQ54DRAFT_299925 [Martensiomyces pterosporus]|nr:hypothetical protein GQ54DRAFT_299925 [Martensiomyces pterosporus]
MNNNSSSNSNSNNNNGNGNGNGNPSGSSGSGGASSTQQAQPVRHVVPAAAFVPPLGDSDYSLTRIIEEYGERNDLLKLVLSAKTEQDRARAEYERRIQEELRFETRRLEFEMMLHSNYFKQQEREQDEKRQQQQQILQQMPPPTHRSDIVLQSPLRKCTAAACPCM